MKFSIIIPCYNTFKYIDKCLKSIINQTFQDWEIITVNDGSTDNTLDLLEDYSAKDNRIRVINQKNKGVSASRNKAIEMARGDYLIFMDSDDWYRDTQGLEQIAKSLQQNDLDIVVFRYQPAAEQNTNYYDKEPLLFFKTMKGQVYAGVKYLSTVLSNAEHYQWFPWMYAFRKELWIRNKFRFDEQLWIQEDADIIYKVILKAQRIGVLDNQIYQYRIRQDSACHSISFHSMEHQLNSCIRNINTVSQMDMDEKLKSLLKSNFAATYFTVLTEANYVDESERRELWRLLNKNQYLMDYARSKRKRVVRMATHIMGVRVISRFLFVRRRYNYNKDK